MKKNNATIKSRIAGAGACIIIPLLFLYLYIAFYYHTHFYTNTVINGISTSNMTVSQAEDAITAEVKAYSLTLEERNGVEDTINGKDINLHTVFEGGISGLLGKQNSLIWPVSLFRPQELTINTMLDYDESSLQKVFDHLNCFDKANDIEPVNASISEFGENGYELLPENQGARVISDKLYDSVSNSIENLQTTLSIEEADCYAKPEITSDNPALIKAQEEMNKLAGAKITYEFGDATEVVDGTKISQWITVDKDFNVSFNTDGIKEFVDYIGKTYNSFGRVRTFKTSYGKTINVKGGDYGWWLNRPEEVKELTQLIQNGEKVEKDPVYFQTAQQYGADDIGNTYVEVNLTAQHLFFYKNGKLILQSDFVSGNVSKHLGTPVGTYPVQYKEENATLVGEDYSTPVKYWMPFNKNIGLHDASWRSAFGKDIYLTNGSHGCINMPPSAAKKMFKYMERGVAVVVYKLSGTESYDVKKNKAKTDNTKTDNTKTDNTKTDNTKTDSTKTGSTKTDSTKTGSAKTDSTKTGNTITDSTKTDSAKTDSDKTVSTKTN
ncbi:MAG TPA: L,D-transpeptidase family protein [Mobilitalea sp.]|nr:L,D-transpeptidase family protein [Mobilitalea sp.]